jgi:transposase-like protein
MAKAKKIKAEELESVQGLVTASRQAEADFFRASTEAERVAALRSAAYQNMGTLQEQLQAKMNELKEVYGDIVVNLETGEYEDAPAQEEAPAMEVVE